MSQAAGEIAGVATRTLTCGANGIRLWPGIVLAEWRGETVRVTSAPDVFRAIAILHGPDAANPALFAALERAARLLTQGRVDEARKIVARIALPPVRREGAALLAKFNPNHYGPGSQGGQFAPAGEGGGGSNNKGNSESQDAINTPVGGDGNEADPAIIPARSVKTLLTYDHAAKLAHDNNLSDLPDELILAVMYKESSFDTSVPPSSSQAKGLMQVAPDALADVMSSHTYGRLFPADPNQIDLNDPATNIQVGSAYIQIRTNVYRGDLEHALTQYAGYSGATSGYASEVLAATQALQQNPSNPISTLESTLHPPKKKPI